MRTEDELTKGETPLAKAVRALVIRGQKGSGADPVPLLGGLERAIGDWRASDHEPESLLNDVESVCAALKVPSGNAEAIQVAVAALSTAIGLREMLEATVGLSMAHGCPCDVCRGVRGRVLGFAEGPLMDVARLMVALCVKDARGER